MKLKNLVNKPITNFFMSRSEVEDDRGFIMYCPYGSHFRAYPMAWIIVDEKENKTIYGGNLDFDNDIEEDVIDPQYVKFCEKQAYDAIKAGRVLPPRGSYKNLGPEGKKIRDAMLKRQKPWSLV